MVVSVVAISVSAAGGEAGTSPATQAPAPFIQAQWIVPPAVHDIRQPLPLFRKEFSVGPKPEKATVRIVGLGDYDLAGFHQGARAGRLPVQF
jgi:hypothetical protein